MQRGAAFALWWTAAETSKERNKRIYQADTMISPFRYMQYIYLKGLT